MQIYIYFLVDIFTATLVANCLWYEGVFLEFTNHCSKLTKKTKNVSSKWVFRPNTAIYF